MGSHETAAVPESKSEKFLGRACLSRKPAKKYVQKKLKPEHLSLMECLAPCKAKPLHQKTHEKSALCAVRRNTKKYAQKKPKPERFETGPIYTEPVSESK